jgi:hypothetical protein
MGVYEYEHSLFLKTIELIGPKMNLLKILPNVSNTGSTFKTKRMPYTIAAALTFKINIVTSTTDSIHTIKPTIGGSIGSSAGKTPAFFACISLVSNVVMQKRKK